MQRVGAKRTIDIPTSSSGDKSIDTDVANIRFGALFSDQQALVVGGSRGLGEVTAKLLAAGGADVRLTYLRGQTDAERIVDDICRGGGRAESFSLDILDPQAALAAQLASGWHATHLYYMATPFIFDAAAGNFFSRLFRQFSDYYVTGFYNVVKLLAPNGLTSVFYPSSTALNEWPANMGEYVASKAAGEALCTFLENQNRNLRIYRPRLQRIATDQTANLLPVENADPFEVMVRHLVSMRSPLVD